MHGQPWWVLGQRRVSVRARRMNSVGWSVEERWFVLFIPLTLWIKRKHSYGEMEWVSVLNTLVFRQLHSGPPLAAGRGWGPAQSLPLLRLFRPEVMSLMLLLPLFPPADGDASQSHIHLSHHRAPKFTFLCILSAYPLFLSTVSIKQRVLLLPLALVFTQILLFSPVSLT